MHGTGREPHQRDAGQRRRERPRAREQGRAATHRQRAVAPDTARCTRGDWDDEATDRYAVAYRWLRDGTEIAGATQSTYTTVRADVQTNVSCRVRAEDLTNATSASLNIRRPDNLVAPAVSGDPRLFRTLSCSRGDWDDIAADRYAVTYSWFRNSTQIPGAAAATYTLTHADVNKSIYCRVRAEDFIDANSGSVYVDTPRAIVPPALSGQPHLRGELGCTRGTWDDTPEKRYAVSYQWYRSGQPISGATDPNYVLGVSDLNRYITCTATAEVLRDSSAQSIYVYGPVRHREPVHRGRRAPAPRADVHARRVERLGGQALRADLPVAAQQPADRRRRRARPRRGRRGRRHEPQLRGHRRGHAHRDVVVGLPLLGAAAADAAAGPRRQRAERVQRVHAAAAQ